jgi:hypothetical protein
MLGVRFLLCATALFLAARGARAADALPVTIEQLTGARAELYADRLVHEGMLGRFQHRREPANVENRTVKELNRDTLYSLAVFDLEEGPVTITMPDPGQRFMSLQIFDRYHFVDAKYYAAGSYTIEPVERGGTRSRYVVAAVHFLVDPEDPIDVQQVHALQDAIQVRQKRPWWFAWFRDASWDPVRQDRVRHALFALGSPVDARLAGRPRRNDAKTVYRAVVKDVPVDGFWSVSVYDADGYYRKNDQRAYSLNSITSWKNADGSVPIQFGGCGGRPSNCLPTVPGWRYEMRLYRLRSAEFDSGAGYLVLQPAN